jgi:pyruvate/2-oxoglutarate/acetoin dehydrogenase E1 component
MSDPILMASYRKDGNVIISEEGMYSMGFSKEHLQQMIDHSFLKFFRDDEEVLFIKTPYRKSVKLFEKGNRKTKRR